MKNKEFFVKQTAEQMELPLDLVAAVVSFQGEDAARAAHTHNEIEFSGLGKFLISQFRVRRAHEATRKLLDGPLEEERRISLDRFINKLEQRII